MIYVYKGSCGVDCNNLYGQGYDGASNMARHIKGTQTKVRENFPKALYMSIVRHIL